MKNNKTKGLKVDCFPGDYNNGRERIQEWIDQNPNTIIEYITSNQTGSLSQVWIFYREVDDVF